MNGHDIILLTLGADILLILNTMIYFSFTEIQEKTEKQKREIKVIWVIVLSFIVIQLFSLKKIDEKLYKSKNRIQKLEDRK